LEIINSINQLPQLEKPLFIALGNFDGVHRGHQAILKAVNEKAQSEKGLSAVLILNPHPISALRPGKSFTLLTDLADRAEIMQELKIDYMIIESFTPAFAALKPLEFVNTILLERLKVKGVFVGENYRFGRQGEGTAAKLEEWGKELGFFVFTQPLVSYKNKKISSTLIRDLILNGAVKEASDYLNYYFFREGSVIHGRGVGNKFIYPTANLISSDELLWPGQGVYLTMISKVKEKPLFGVTNVGSIPTFKVDDKRMIETHIMDFNENIYNQTIRLCFLDKLRDTAKFISPEKLKEQISQDIIIGRHLIEKIQMENNGNGHSLQAGCSVLRS
jgi:riboflavin kinase / FMN adenylyltransferase